jgi:hypothetical protein
MLTFFKTGSSVFQIIKMNELAQHRSKDLAWKVTSDRNTPARMDTESEIEQFGENEVTATVFIIFAQEENIFSTCTIMQ